MNESSQEAIDEMRRIIDKDVEDQVNEMMKRMWLDIFDPLSAKLKERAANVEIADLIDI